MHRLLLDMTSVGLWLFLAAAGCTSTIGEVNLVRKSSGEHSKDDEGEGLYVS